MYSYGLQNIYIIYKCSLVVIRNHTVSPSHLYFISNYNSKTGQGQQYFILSQLFLSGLWMKHTYNRKFPSGPWGDTVGYRADTWDIVLLSDFPVPTLILDPYIMVIMHDPHVCYSFFFCWLLLVRFKAFILCYSPGKVSFSLSLSVLCVCVL